MIVRSWTDDDTEQLLDWFGQDPELWRYIGLPQRPKVGDVHMHVLQRMKQELDGTALIRAVEDDGALVGYVTLYPHLPTHSVCHIIVAPWMRGHGVAIGKAALQAAKDAGITHVVAPLLNYVPPAVGQRWLRRIGFSVQYYGEWHA